MGYFSFIKYILKKLFSKKMLVFLIIFLLSLIIKNNCFATVSDFPNPIEIEGNNYTFPTNNTHLNNGINNYKYYLFEIWKDTTYGTQYYYGTIYFTNKPLCFKPVTSGTNTTWRLCNTDGTSTAGSYKVKTQSFRNGYNKNVIGISNGSNTTGTSIQPSNTYSTYPSTTPNVTDSTSDGYVFFISNYSFNFVDTSGAVIGNIYNNFEEPSIENDSLSITDWDFSTLDINLGSVTSPDLDVLVVSYNGNSHILGLSNYYTPNVSVIHIPIQDLNNLIVFTDEGTVEFYYLDKISLTTSTINRYQLGMYNVSISTDKADELNSQADRDIQNDIYNQQVITNENLNNINNTQQETNEKIDEIKDTITDDTVESSADDLPSTDVSDPSETGIDNIFQSIYNAFCVGQAQDIVFPVPFTNKNITLSPYYVRDMLNNNGAGWVYTLIQAFWGYLIGRYIVKDISKKITKIKGGDIENIENENIKEEML